MYIIVFGIFILKLQISVSQIPGFPAHIDLQKVGEAIFNNEKFNILKPTTHHITDHFKDTMLREISVHPAKRVFIDKNGFRHDWSGFGEKVQSLRKTDLKYVSASFENSSHNSTNDQKNITAAVRNSSDNTSKVTDENSDHEEENNDENSDSDNIDTVEKITEEDAETLESIETAIKNNITHKTQDKNSTTESVFEKKLRAGDNDTKTTKKPKADEKKDSKKNDDKDKKNKDDKKGKEDKKAKEDKKETAKKKETPKKERTVATTTFFCPFFGVITMSAFID